MQGSLSTEPSSIFTTSLAASYRSVRELTSLLCEPLVPEDCVIQSMPDVSPTRWHLAHTTWFFETFVLQQALRNYRPYDDAYAYFFNSYYNSIGKQFPRAQRGLLSRPTVDEVCQYRQHVDQHMKDLLASGEVRGQVELGRVIELGLHHEQQHQELMLADIKHVLSCNPLFPVYHDPVEAKWSTTVAMDWVEYDEGVFAFGNECDGFCFDNEAPRHRAFLHDYGLANRLTTNAEYLQFVEDGGYRQPDHWLSIGWSTVAANDWRAPLYWIQKDGAWHEFTLGGLRPLNPLAPVCHVSYFEADAFARWSGQRLPTEFEWEHAGAGMPRHGNFVQSQSFAPQPADQSASSPSQMYGDVWEWTCSSYAAYPGYRPLEGSLGEYNGKFMCNQYVLRGGSCATPANHIRPTYRNFFPPDARWQFSGIRLCRQQ